MLSYHLLSIPAILTPVSLKGTIWNAPLMSTVFLSPLQAEVSSYLKLLNPLPSVKTWSNQPHSWRWPTSEPQNELSGMVEDWSASRIVDWSASLKQKAMLGMYQGHLKGWCCARNARDTFLALSTTMRYLNQSIAPPGKLLRSA